MKYRYPLIAVATALLLGFAATATATTTEESAVQTEEAQLQAQLEAEYAKAIAEAEQERRSAEVSMEKAREQLQQVAVQRAQTDKENTRARAAKAAEMEKMHRELNQARRQLREASREIARVNQEVSRAQARHHNTSDSRRTSERPVIGIVLGEADDVGVRVLGVSPDGPSERAGIKAGDVIVALGGHVLAAVEDSANAKSGLYVAMKDLQPGEPVTVTLERDDKTLDLNVVPEVREPLTWHTIARFPTAPVAPGQVISVKRIEVPEIDTEAIAGQIEQMRIEIEERHMLMEPDEVVGLEREYEIEFHDMSELGGFALHDANAWFGLPMARGLKLAEINPDLGAYFKTERGVLVLQAKADNDLQLISGDVILQVGDTEVNSPAEFMRALREFESGQELSIGIKRERKNKTLDTIMPKSHARHIAPEGGHARSVRITHKTD